MKRVPPSISSYLSFLIPFLFYLNYFFPTRNSSSNDFSPFWCVSLLFIFVWIWPCFICVNAIRVASPLPNLVGMSRTWQPSALTQPICIYLLIWNKNGDFSCRNSKWKHKKRFFFEWWSAFYGLTFLSLTCATRGDRVSSIHYYEKRKYGRSPSYILYMYAALCIHIVSVSSV